MPDNGFLAGPDNLDRALEFHNRQRQHDLHGHVFPSAESAADGRINNADLLCWQAKRMGDLFLVGVSPLTAALDCNAAFFVQVGQPGFRLEVGVLLVWRMVFAFDDHVCFGKSRLHITLADFVPDANVGIADFRMDARRIRLHRLDCVVDGRQILVFHADQVARFGGDGFRLGDNNCHPVALAADDIGPHRPPQFPHFRP